MRVGIVGSRNFTDKRLMYEAVGDYTAGEGHITIVSGGADGADTLAREMAAETESAYIEHLPERAVFGWPRAAFERNTLIVRDSDVLFAFFGPGQPKMKGDRHFGSGTMDTVQKAMSKRIPVFIYFQGGSDDE
jgi:hypothetical protein